MMRHVCRVVWLVGLVLVVGVAYGAEQPKRGAANAVMVEKGPDLDGTMKDAVWAQCPEMPMGSCTGEDLQKYKTWGRVLFSPLFSFSLSLGNGSASQFDPDGEKLFVFRPLFADHRIFSRRKVQRLQSFLQL